MSLARKDPLASLLQAAKNLPMQTGAVERFQARIDAGGTEQVILADVSSSMAEPAGSRTKIEVLEGALRSAPQARLIAFSSTPREIAWGSPLPVPSGGTALHLALDLATTMRPARTLVISDGQPDSPTAALGAAERLPGVIDVIYCGPDDDAAARAFMVRLARAGGGRYVGQDVRRGPAELGPAIRALLDAPRGGAR